MLFSSTDPLDSDCYFQFSDNEGVTITNRPNGDNDGVTITNRPNVDNNCDGLTANQQSTSVDRDVAELLESVPRIADVFNVHRKIGTGTFSSVYLALLKGRPAAPQFALKHIIPTSHPSRIQSELRCLQDIGGRANVMGVSACLREKDQVIIVMPYFPHDKFQDYVRCMDVQEIRDYMWNLLLALCHVHKANFIHRDIKPSNFLYNRQLKQYALVDFGLAQQAPVPLTHDAPCTTPMSISRAKMAALSKSSADCNVKVVDSETRNTSTLLSYKSRRCKMADGQPTSSPSKKRKINMHDIENQSPRKRRHHTEMHCKLAESNNKSNVFCDRISKHAEKTASMGLQNLDVNTMEPDPMKGGCRVTVPSPRRIVLTRRALDLTEKCSLLEPAACHPSRQLLSPSTTVAGHRHMAISVTPAVCQCYGQPTICSICMGRTVQKAPRAGTPGFRSPEVLMRWPDQTTSVDIWSTGVIFLSLLSGRYPFFKATDDMMALAQITSVIGSDDMKTAAAAYGKKLTVSAVMPGLNLKTMCERLQANNKTSDKSCDVPDTAYSLLKELLNPNPVTRMSAAQALQHPFFGSLERSPLC